MHLYSEPFESNVSLNFDFVFDDPNDLAVVQDFCIKPAIVGSYVKVEQHMWDQEYAIVSLFNPKLSVCV